MIRKILTASVALAIAGFAALPAQAQSTQEALAAELDGVMTNMVDLAEVFPAEKYEWAPTEAVFPFRRHLVHAAQATYFFVGLGGVEAPEGVDYQGALETVMEKDDVVAFVEQAHEVAVAGIRDMSDETLHSMVELFDGSTRSVHAALLIHLRHTSEHLGQLIAYARMRDVVPPWSQ